MLPELPLEELDELAAVLAFLGGHLAEHFGGGRVVFAQSIRKIAVDAAVLFLVADGQRQDLFLAEL